MLTFTCDGVPVPQGSKKAIPHKSTGRTMLIDTKPGPLKKWRNAVAVEAAKAVKAISDDVLFLEGAVYAELTYFMPRPKSHYRTGRNAHLLRAGAPEFPSSKPDVDKLVRATFDAMTSIVWKDDSQVVGLLTMEFYADQGAAPGVHVLVRSLA